ncbi:MAG: amphi-Trp domain-containing protein [Humidesulfovibrio sp.]|nr:amphi-Trp domain-containing protein [Humidesulfovibrio sp.]
MSSDGKFEFDSVQDEKSIQAFLAALTEGFGKGRVVLRSDSEEITLTPGPLVSFAVKAKRKDGESKMTIKISWKDAKSPIATGERTLQVEA